MKRILALLFLLGGVCSAQQIQPRQIVPCAVEGDVLTTVSGVTTCQPPAGTIKGSGTVNDIPLWTSTSLLGNSPLSVSNSPTTGGVFDANTFYGQDVCWHYQSGNSPLTECLRYAGHGNFYGPYATNDGINFIPGAFSVGQLQVSNGGGTGGEGILFFNGDTNIGGSTNLVGFNGYATAPTGTCPNIGGLFTNPIWALGADETLSYCTNNIGSTWQSFASGAAGPASGDLSGTYPHPTVSGIQGNPVASGTPTAAQSLVWQQSTKSYAPHAPVVLPTSNVWFFTDSVGEGGGATNYTTDGWNVATGVNANSGWGYQVASAIGAGIVTNKGGSGSLAADIVDSQVCSGNTTTKSIVSSVYGSTLSYLEEGINDARQTNSTVTAREITYLQAEWAAIVTLGIPSSLLTTAFSHNVTYSGSVTPAYYFQNCPGQTMLTASETATATLTTVGNPIFVQGVTYNSDTGTYTVTIDGNPAIDSITGATGTFSNAPFAGTFLAAAPFTQLVTMQRFAQYSVSGTPTTIPAGSHTIVITVTTPGTNGITFNWAASPQPQSFDYGTPTEQIWGVPYQQANAQSAQTAAYDALNMASCAQAQTDGINAFCYETRTTALPLTGPNSITIGMSGTDQNNGQGVTLSDVSCTSGSSICTSTNYYFSSADTGTGGITGKRIYIEGAGASGGPLYATIGSLANFTGPNFSSHSISLVNSLTGVQLLAGTTVSNATTYVGGLCQVSPASTAAGLHPNDCGHLQLARGSLGNMQPTTAAPNYSVLLNGNPTFTGNPTFNNYIQTTGLMPGITIVTPGFIHPTSIENVIEINAASGITGLILQGFQGVASISFGSPSTGTGMTIGTYTINASSGAAQLVCIVSSSTAVNCVISNSGASYGITPPTFNLSALGGTPPGVIATLGSPLNAQAYTIKRIDNVPAFAVSVISGGKYNGTANQTVLLTPYQSLDVWYDATNQGWWSKSGNPMTTLGDTIYGGASGVETRLAGPTAGAATYFLGQTTSGSTAVAPTWVNTNTLGSGLSGMTAGQVPIAATATTVTSSKPIAGSGAGLTSGPTSVTGADVVIFTGSAGQIIDSGFGVVGTSPTGVAGTSGSFTNGHCRSTDANGREVDSGGSCGGSGSTYLKGTCTISYSTGDTFDTVPAVTVSGAAAGDGVSMSFTTTSTGGPMGPVALGAVADTNTVTCDIAWAPPGAPNSGTMTFALVVFP